jgi:hypothetical protein
MNDELMLIGLANEFREERGWVMLAPFGDFENSGRMQRFQREDAVNIVNEFTRATSEPTYRLGIPWYIGHPDHDSFKQRYTDTKAYGRVKRLEARDNGLFGNVVWSGDGKRLIEGEAFHGHSPHWLLRKDYMGGSNVWRPFSLKSVGFTNEPNLPVPPVTSANERSDMKDETKDIQKTFLRLINAGWRPEQAAAHLKTTRPKEWRAMEAAIPGGIALANEQANARRLKNLMPRVQTLCITVAKEMEQRLNLAWVPAWRKAEDAHPRLFGILRGEISLANEAESVLAEYSSKSDGAPVTDPNYVHFPRLVMTALGLPPQASEKMWRDALDKADGMDPRLAAQVFNGLVEAVMKVQGIGFNAAWIAAKAKYPKVFAAMDNRRQ